MRKVLAVAVLMMALAATTASAEKGEFVMGGTGGGSIPTGDLGDFVDPGFDAGVFVDYGVANNCTIGATAAYHSLGVPDEFISFLGADDVTFSILQFTAHARYWFPTGGAMMPFVTVGGGIYNGKTKVDGGPAASDDSESKGGFYGGAGVDYKMGPMWRIGVEGDYHYVLDAATDSSGEDTAGQIFGINARVSFTFAGQTQ